MPRKSKTKAKTKVQKGGVSHPPLKSKNYEKGAKLRKTIIGLNRNRNTNSRNWKNTKKLSFMNKNGVPSRLTRKQKSYALNALALYNTHNSNTNNTKDTTNTTSNTYQQENSWNNEAPSF
jgi:hypothetical protein